MSGYIATIICVILIVYNIKIQIYDKIVCDKAKHFTHAIQFYNSIHKDKISASDLDFECVNKRYMKLVFLKFKLTNQDFVPVDVYDKIKQYL